MHAAGCERTPAGRFSMRDRGVRACSHALPGVWLGKMRQDRAEILRLVWPSTREVWEVGVLYEDECLMAVDKPAGLLSSPDRYDPDRPNLMKLLHVGIAEGAGWAASRGITYLFNAHRLDLETSGILLLAKSKPALIHLADQFGGVHPRKRYVALVTGEWGATAEVEVEAPLAPHPHRPGVVRVDPKGGRPSQTRFRVQERFRGYSLLSCEPVTGRTHQLRVHARHLGFPMVGDLTYGGKPLLLSRLKPGYRLKPGHRERPLIGRVALHAECLEVTHPVSGGRVVIESPWPKDLRVAIRYLSQFVPVTGPAVPQESPPGPTP